MWKLLCLGLMFVGSIFGGELENIEKTSKIWQHNFSMDKWKVSVEVVGEDSIRALVRDYDPEHFLYGGSYFDTKERKAIVRVLKSSEYTPDMLKAGHLKTKKDIFRDQKNTVVHEYMHAMYEFPTEEWAVSKITSLLLHEKPKKK